MSGREKKGKAPAKGKAKPAAEEEPVSKKKGGKKKGQEDDDITEEELLAARMAKLALKNKKAAAPAAEDGEPEANGETDEAAPAAEAPAAATEAATEGADGAEEIEPVEAAPKKGANASNGTKGNKKGGKGAKGIEEEPQEEKPESPAKGGKKGGKKGAENEEVPAKGKKGSKAAAKAEDKGEEEDEEEEDKKKGAPVKGKKGAKEHIEEEEKPKAKKGGKAAANAEEEPEEKPTKGGKKGSLASSKTEEETEPIAKKDNNKSKNAKPAPAAAAVPEEEPEEEMIEAEAEGEEENGGTEEATGEEEGGEEGEEGTDTGKGAKGGKNKKLDARRKKAEAEAKKREEAARKKAQRRVEKATAPTQPQEISVASSAGVGANGEVRDYPWYVELKGKNRLKNRDIICDNFGVTLGGQVLLKEGTKLSLIYGHKYGMVGRNGLGKSVMLRKISGRDPDLNIPEYIRILHVEQEVVGDEKTPLQSVLEADQEREWLLKEEKRMLAVKDKNKAPTAAPSTTTTTAPAATAIPTPATPASAPAPPAAAAVPKAAVEEEKEEEEEEERSYTLADIYERLREIESDKAESRAATILAGLGFGIQELRTKKTKEYSGGWRMRIALARALFCQPDLLLLDEPNNHLDLEACIWLENYLVDWKKTLLVVSHDSAFLNEFVDHVIHIHQKTLTTYKGDYDTFVKVRESNRRTKQKKHDAIQKKEDALKSFIQKNQNRQGKSRQHMLDKMEEVELDVDDPTMKFSFPESGGLGPLPLKFKDVSFKYGDRTIFQHLNFGIDCESRIALVGRNGVGKSTLMNLMVGQLEATTGEIERDRHMRVARFTQHHVDQLDLTVTVMNYFKERFPGAKDQEIRQHVAKFGITNNLPNQKIETLSGGQKSRVAFAELAWKRPHILYLDEPSNHLDVEAIESLARALAAFDGGVVLISHNQYLVQLVCNEIWIVGNQTVTRLEGNFSDYKKLVAKEIGLTYV